MRFETSYGDDDLRKPSLHVGYTNQKSFWILASRVNCEWIQASPFVQGAIEKYSGFEKSYMHVETLVIPYTVQMHWQGSSRFPKKKKLYAMWIQVQNDCKPVFPGKKEQLVVYSLPTPSSVEYFVQYTVSLTIFSSPAQSSVERTVEHPLFSLLLRTGRRNTRTHDFFYNCSPSVVSRPPRTLFQGK